MRQKACIMKSARDMAGSGAWRWHGHHLQRNPSQPVPRSAKPAHRVGYLPSRLPVLPPVSSDLRALVDRLADALGPDAPAEQVERVAQAVLAARRGGQRDIPASPPPQSSGRALVLAFGPDA